MLIVNLQLMLYLFSINAIIYALFWGYGNAEKRPEHKAMVIQKEALFMLSFIMHPFGNP